MNVDLLIVAVAVNETDSELADHICAMRNIRKPGSEIRCLIDGYNDDPRPLWEISEVQTLCGRLMRSGFASHLDFGNGPGQPQLEGWGVAEVYLCSTGRLGPQIPWTRELIEEVCGAWSRYNVAADAIPDEVTTN